jgi:hypothetical protein
MNLRCGYRRESDTAGGGTPPIQRNIHFVIVRSAGRRDGDPYRGNSFFKSLYGCRISAICSSPSTIYCEGLDTPFALTA